MGLLEPTRGQILIDGVPLSPNNRAAWQRSVAHVPQSIFLSDTTIARNIAFGRAPETMRHADIAEAARLAQLDEVITALPGGLDTRIGERGIKLSGGQKQRLGIARGIYKDVPVVLLTRRRAHWTTKTEAAVLGAMRALSALGKTLVTIAHRESTLRNCDRIITLEAGRVVSVESRGRA